MSSVHLSEVGVVNVSHDVEQKLLHFLQNNFEVCGKLVPVFSREHRLVIDNLKKYFTEHHEKYFTPTDLLHISHDVVDVLRRGELALLALVIQPHVDPGHQSEMSLVVT